MSGYPTTPSDDWQPVPHRKPEDRSDDQDGGPHLFGPRADGCMALFGVMLAVMLAGTLIIHLVLMFLFP